MLRVPPWLGPAVLSLGLVWHTAHLLRPVLRGSPAPPISAPWRPPRWLLSVVARMPLHGLLQRLLRGAEWLAVHLQRGSLGWRFGLALALSLGLLLLRVVLWVTLPSLAPGPLGDWVLWNFDVFFAPTTVSLIEAPLYGLLGTPLPLLQFWALVLSFSAFYPPKAIWGRWVAPLELLLLRSWVADSGPWPTERPLRMDALLQLLEETPRLWHDLPRAMQRQLLQLPERETRVHVLQIIGAAGPGPGQTPPPPPLDP